MELSIELQIKQGKAILSELYKEKRAISKKILNFRSEIRELENRLKDKTLN